jgi:hypothetical protein
MPSKKSQKPNSESALSRIQAMAAMPRETPLERFVFDHFDAIISLKTQRYAVPDIAKVLKEEGFSASPPTVHAALNRASVLLNKPNPYRRTEVSSTASQPDHSSDEDDTTTEEWLPEPKQKNKLAY